MSNSRNEMIVVQSDLDEYEREGRSAAEMLAIVLVGACVFYLVVIAAAAFILARAAA